MTDFDSAPIIFAKAAAQHLGVEICREGRIVRDVFGRLLFVTRKSIEKNARDNFVDSVRENLKGYVDPHEQPIAHIDKATFDKLADEPFYRVDFADGNQDFTGLIDRRLAGDDWLLRPKEISHEPRIMIFYSIKGGVGRSTALAVTTAHLAEKGKNVLVIDFDLEAPALGTLLLDQNSLPEYGIVDWFAAVASGADTEIILPDIIGSSPFTSAQAIVHVAPCFGKKGGDYISKLARAYTPGSAGEVLSEAGFAEKANQLIEQLKSRRQYDVVLIDARAGLHETSGALLLGLGARSLLFGVDTTQTFDGYGLLLSALRTVFEPELGNPDLRGAFKMVHAKAPQSPEERREFVDASWTVWSDTLYDAEEDAPHELSTTDHFVFDVSDDTAPHFPLEITGNEGYARFDPRKRAYSLESTNYEPVFGSFLAGVTAILGLVE